MFAFALYIWAFVKEIFAGKKLHDPYEKKQGLNFTPPALASALLTKMQKSRRVLACVCLLLMMSLFVNYRTISKLLVITRATEETVKFNEVPVKETPIVKPTLPPKNKEPTSINVNEAEVKKQTIDFLEGLYGVK